ncbi:hypothetical protein ACFX2I_010055 [Malus domestica]
MEEAKKAIKEVVEAKNQVQMWKFGDDKSSLLDQFERLSVDLQLNQAMLRRSLSEPMYIRSEFPLLLTQGPPEPSRPPPPPPPSPPHLVAKKRRGSGFNKVLKKMIKPILRRMSGKKKDFPIPEAKDPRFWKTFSRSKELQRIIHGPLYDAFFIPNPCTVFHSPSPPPPPPPPPPPSPFSRTQYSGKLLFLAAPSSSATNPTTTHQKPSKDYILQSEFENPNLGFDDTASRLQVQNFIDGIKALPLKKKE